MKHLSNILFLFFLFLIFSACNADEDPKPQQENILEVTKDGEQFTATSFINILIREEQFGVTGRRLDIRTEVDEGTLIISVTNWDWQNPPDSGILTKFYGASAENVHSVCREAPDVTYCDSGLLTYLVGSKTYTSAFQEGEGFVEITTCDPEKKLVSGRFETVIEDLFQEEQIMVKGTFEKLPYQVL